MADLLTHYVSARVCAIPMRNRAAVTTFCLGVFVPDLVGKALGAMEFLPDLFEIPSHSLPGTMLLAWMASLAFSRDFRWTAAWTILLGAWLHIAVDSLKDYLGRGVTVLLHPCSCSATELGVYRSEDVFVLLPANVGILALLWMWERRRTKP